MAKKKSEGKSGKSPQEPRLTAAQRAQRWQLLVGIMLIILALYLLAAYLCHLFTWSSDQSLVWQDLLRPLEVHAANYLGSIGATLANVSISRGFGVAALLIPLLIAFYGSIVLGVRYPHLYRRQMLMVVGLVLISIDLGFFFGLCGGYLGSGLGGDFGHYISLWCLSLLGTAGTAILLVVISLFYLMWLSGRVSRRVYKALETFANRLKTFRERQPDTSAPDPASTGEQSDPQSQGPAQPLPAAPSQVVVPVTPPPLRHRLTIPLYRLKPLLLLQKMCQRQWPSRWIVPW